MKVCSPPSLFSGDAPLHLELVRPTNSAPSPAPGLERHQLERLIEDWFSDSEIRCFSPRTIEERRNKAQRLYWFLDTYQLTNCGTPELRRFFAYLTNGHTHASGRWGKTLGGKKVNERYARPLRPVTIETYHRMLKAFFTWAVKQDYLPASPMNGVPRPLVREDQQQPFTDDHIAALLRAAAKTTFPKRDTAILWLLLDTGLRASELCNLTCADIDIDQRIIMVLGKGNKKRTLSFGLKTRRVLMAYIREMTAGAPGETGSGPKPTDPLFPSSRGTTATAKLSNRALALLFKRLAKSAGITGMKCSPHIARHTYAFKFLQPNASGSGGDAFTLMRSLGHRDLKMTRNYVNMATGDVVDGMRRNSPMDKLK